MQTELLTDEMISVMAPLHTLEYSTIYRIHRMERV